MGHCTPSVIETNLEGVEQLKIGNFDGHPVFCMCMPAMQAATRGGGPLLRYVTVRCRLAKTPIS